MLYPSEAKQKDIDKKLEEINEQLAYKQFSIGRYYHKAGKKQAANLYFNMVVSDWPGTRAAELAEQMLAGGSSGNESEDKDAKS
jgi:outer membrane protein assembly factor BamD (BamD/ComL family)